MSQNLLRRLGVGALAVAGVLAVGAAPAYAGTAATLVLRPVDAKNGSPIPDFCGTIDATYLCSNGSGEISLGGLAGGTHDIWLQPNDRFHLMTSTTVDIAPDVTTIAPVPVKKGGRISTVVTDAATGQPVAGACAYALTTTNAMPPDGWTGCSDATGLLTTGLVLPGTYELFVTAPWQSGYGAQWLGAAGGTGQQPSAQQITVTASTTVTAPATRLDPAAVVIGTVTDAGTGAPQALTVVSVHAYDPGTGLEGIGSVTNDVGQYRIDGLGPYAWPLLISAPGHAQQWSGGTGNRNHATPVQLSATTATTYDVAVKTGVAVTGSVTVGGMPMASGRIVAYNTGTGDVVGSDDFSGGAYQLLLAGSQVVKLLVYDFNGASAGVWFGGSDQAGATSVTVPSKTPVTVAVVLP